MSFWCLLSRRVLKVDKWYKYHPKSSLHVMKQNRELRESTNKSIETAIGQVARFLPVHSKKRLFNKQVDTRPWFFLPLRNILLYSNIGLWTFNVSYRRPIHCRVNLLPLLSQMSIGSWTASATWQTLSTILTEVKPKSSMLFGQPRGTL